MVIFPFFCNFLLGNPEHSTAIRAAMSFNSVSRYHYVQLVAKSFTKQVSV